MASRLCVPDARLSLGDNLSLGFKVFGVAPDGLSKVGASALGTPRLDLPINQGRSIRADQSGWKALPAGRLEQRPSINSPARPRKSVQFTRIWQRCPCTIMAAQSLQPQHERIITPCRSRRLLGQWLPATRRWVSLARGGISRSQPKLQRRRSDFRYRNGPVKRPMASKAVHPMLVIGFSARNGRHMLRRPPC